MAAAHTTASPGPLIHSAQDSSGSSSDVDADEVEFSDDEHGEAEAVAAVCPAPPHAALLNPAGSRKRKEMHD